MHFEAGGIYHIYNRSITDQKIFQNQDHYFLFLEKVRREWLPYCEILGYCLMPAHFHFEVIVNEAACEYIILNDKESNLQRFSKAIGKTLSSYTRALQRQQGKRLNLFAKKTKAKLISERFTPIELHREYVINAFTYIHQNPVNAQYCVNAEDWEMSSAREYSGERKGGICNVKKMQELTGLSEVELQELIGIKIRPKKPVYPCRCFENGKMLVTKGFEKVNGMEGLRAINLTTINTTESSITGLPRDAGGIGGFGGNTGQATVSGLTSVPSVLSAKSEAGQTGKATSQQLNVQIDAGNTSSRRKLKIIKRTLNPNVPPATDSPNPQALPRPPT